MRRWSILLAIIVLAVLGGAGCATVRPDVNLQLPGDVNPDREDAIVREFGAQLSAGAAPASDVKVVDAMLTPNMLVGATASRDGQFLGRVQLTKPDLIEDLKLLTGVLGGNLAVASFSTSFESDSSLIATVSADVYRSDAASLPEARGPLLPPTP